jgi:hypothetical protein
VYVCVPSIHAPQRTCPDDEVPDDGAGARVVLVDVAGARVVLVDVAGATVVLVDVDVLVGAVVVVVVVGHAHFGRHAPPPLFAAPAIGASVTTATSEAIAAPSVTTL